jgi:GNAT superfamily N-acetyltransferase
MLDLTVRLLSQEDWPPYRAVRLTASRESADALGASFDQEAAADDDPWRAQVDAGWRLVVELDGRPCGVVSVEGLGEEAGSAHLTGPWIDPSARCTGAAGRLVETAATLASAEGIKRLYYRVGTENAGGIGFATSSGSRVTSHRRAAAAGGEDPAGGTETALILSLEDDPATVPDAGGLVSRNQVTQPGRR